MLNRCAGGWAEQQLALHQIAHTGDAIADLADQHLIGQVYEQSVFENPRKVVDLLLKPSRIGDAARKTNVEHQVALVGDHGARLFDCHAQLGLATHGAELALHLAPGARQHFDRQQKAQIQPFDQLGGVHHHHKPVGAARHQLFLDVAGTTTFDQLKIRVDLIGAVDGQIDAIDG